MPTYNLTARQQKLLCDLVELCNRSSDGHFFLSGEIGAAARVFAPGSGGKVAASETDISRFEAEDLITFHWTGSHSGKGSVAMRAIEAVTNNFELPATPPAQINVGDVNTGGGPFQLAAGSNTQRIVSQSGGDPSVAQLLAMVSELLGMIRVALPAIEAQGAEADITAIVEAVQSPAPDSAKLGDRLTSLCSKIGGAVAAGNTLAEGVQKSIELWDKVRPWLEQMQHFARSHGL